MKRPGRTRGSAGSPPRVFVAFLEVRPCAGSVLDPGEVAGAFVRCYVVALDTRSALRRVRAALVEDRFKIMSVEWCVDDGAVTWEEPHSPAALKAIRQARRTGEVVYGRFDTWGAPRKGGRRTAT